jgi:hypothetical protein
MRHSPEQTLSSHKNARSSIKSALVGTSLAILPAQASAQQIYGQVAVELGTLAAHNIENANKVPTVCTRTTIRDFPDIRCNSARSTIDAELPLGVIHGTIGYRERNWGLGLSTTITPGWGGDRFPSISLSSIDIVASYRPRVGALWSMNASVGLLFYDPSFMSSLNINPSAAVGASLYTSRSSENPRGFFTISLGTTLFPTRPTFGADAFYTFAAGVEIQ